MPVMPCSARVVLEGYCAEKEMADVVLGKRP